MMFDYNALRSKLCEIPLPVDDIAHVLQKFVDAATAAAQEPMACGHPRACWGDTDSYSPINGVNMKTGEGQPFGHCLWCAERERHEAEVKGLVKKAMEAEQIRCLSVVEAQITSSTGPTGGWLDSPKALLVAIALHLLHDVDAAVEALLRLHEKVSTNGK